MRERIKDYRILRGQSYFRGNGKLLCRLICTLQNKIGRFEEKAICPTCFPFVFRKELIHA